MIQQIKSKLAAFHNDVSKKEKKIKPAWFFFLLFLLFASCQEEEGDSLLGKSPLARMAIPI